MVTALNRTKATTDLLSMVDTAGNDTAVAGGGGGTTTTTTTTTTVAATTSTNVDAIDTTTSKTVRTGTGTTQQVSTTPDSNYVPSNAEKAAIIEWLTNANPACLPVVAWNVLSLYETGLGDRLKVTITIAINGSTDTQFGYGLGPLALFPKPKLVNGIWTPTAPYIAPPAPPPPPAVGSRINTDVIGTVGQPIAPTLPVQASEGTPPYTYSTDSDLTAVGLSMNPNTGIVTGTPSRAIIGKTFIVTIMDVNGQTTQNSFLLKISEAPLPVPTATPIISSKTLTQFLVADPWIPVVGTGGTPPYTYIISPPEPAGLSLDVNTGRISGTPTIPQSSTTYTITVSDYNSKLASAATTIDITEMFIGGGGSITPPVDAGGGAVNAPPDEGTPPGPTTDPATTLDLNALMKLMTDANADGLAYVSGSNSQLSGYIQHLQQLMAGQSDAQKAQTQAIIDAMNGQASTAQAQTQAMLDAFTAQAQLQQQNASQQQQALIEQIASRDAEIQARAQAADQQRQQEAADLAAKQEEERQAILSAQREEEAVQARIDAEQKRQAALETEFERQQALDAAQAADANAGIKPRTLIPPVPSMPDPASWTSFVANRPPDPNTPLQAPSVALVWTIPWPAGTVRARTIQDCYSVTEFGAPYTYEYSIGTVAARTYKLFRIRNKSVTNLIKVTVILPEFLKSVGATEFIIEYDSSRLVKLYVDENAALNLAFRNLKTYFEMVEVYVDILNVTEPVFINPSNVPLVTTTTGASTTGTTTFTDPTTGRTLEQQFDSNTGATTTTDATNSILAAKLARINNKLGIL